MRHFLRHLLPLCGLTLTLGTATLVLRAAHAAPSRGVAKTPVAALPSSLAVRGKKVTALIFLARDCPISNAYASEISRLNTAFAPRGVAFRLVYEDTSNLAQAKAHARDYRLKGNVLVDVQTKLAGRAGVRVTPEAVVVLPNERIVYRGRINDLFADVGKRRRVVTRHDLRDALNQALRGNSTRLVTTKAFGCFIVSH